MESTVHRYDPAKDAWEAVEPMPTARSHLSCTVLENRLCVIGGHDFQYRGSRTVEVYDPSWRSWDGTCPAMGIPRCSHACVTMGDQIYALGGGVKPCTGDSVERYDARTNRWESRASMYEARGHRAYAVMGDRIYATGGQDARGYVLKTVQRYDAWRDCWEPVQDMPCDRMYHAAAVLDDLLYVIGGNTSRVDRFIGGGTSRVDRFIGSDTSRVDRFDPTRHEWKSVAPLAVGRLGLVAVTARERIYAIGGEKGPGIITTITPDVEAFDADSNTWTPCKPMLSPRWRFAAGVLTVDEP